MDTQDKVIHILGKKHILKILEFCIVEKKFNDIKKSTDDTSTNTITKIRELIELDLLRKKKSLIITYQTTEKGIQVLNKIKEIESMIDKKDINEILVKCIKDVLENIGSLEYHHICNELEQKYQMSLSDCIRNPTPLKNIMIDIFGDASRSSLQEISESILRSCSDEKTKAIFSKFAEELV